jgi:hypothetical protein
MEPVQFTDKFKLEAFQLSGQAAVAPRTRVERLEDWR